VNTTPDKTSLDRVFHISVFIKGIDGVLETMGALILLFVPLSKIQGLGSLTVYELQQDNHAFIANAVIHLNGLLTPNVAVISALYLLVHGTIKLVLAVALFKNLYRLYPYAIGLLLISICYQSYRIGVDRSLVLTVLTLFDIFIVGMTYLEWHRHPVRRSRLRLRPDEIIIVPNDGKEKF
jgi:uncharacterized membrane protein